jgi:transcriptional regulator with XRE-family HTH domain
MSLRWRSKKHAPRQPASRKKVSAIAFADSEKQGLTQTELGDRIGISQRVVTYYEREGGTLSPDLLVKFAEALDVSTDALLGVQRDARHAAADIQKPASLALWRRFRRIEQFPDHDRKTILRMIDALAERTGSGRD